HHRSLPSFPTRRSSDLVAALAGCESMSNPAQQTPDPGNRTAAVESVPGQYIVVLQDNVADPATVARDHVNAAGGSLLRVYTSARSEEHTSELQSRGHLV